LENFEKKAPDVKVNREHDNKWIKQQNLREEENKEDVYEQTKSTNFTEKEQKQMKGKFFWKIFLEQRMRLTSWKKIENLVFGF